MNTYSRQCGVVKHQQQVKRQEGKTSEESEEEERKEETEGETSHPNWKQKKAEQKKESGTLTQLP